MGSQNLEVTEEGVTKRKVIDWRRYQIGISIRGADEKLGAIQLGRTEMRILKALLTKDFGGGACAAHESNEGLNKLLHVISDMEDFMTTRGIE